MKRSLIAGMRSETSDSDSTAKITPLSSPVKKNTETSQPSITSPSPKTKRALETHTCLVHTAIRASPFSKESSEQNYRGFYNLALLLLFVLNMRLVLENHLKYGILVHVDGINFINDKDLFWGLIILLGLAMNVLALFLIEVFAKKMYLQKKPMNVYYTAFHVANIASTILIPSMICWLRMDHPAVGGITLMMATITFLKCISYVLVNAELRMLKSPLTKRAFSSKTASSKQDPLKEATLHEEESSDESKSLLANHHNVFVPNEIQYPDNIDWSNLVYFIVAPTLCYQTSYPRTLKFRKSEFAKRIIEWILATVAMVFLAQQYAVPTLQNSISALEDMNLVKLVERIMKFSVVSVMIWLLMFYSFFHSFLNALAELLRFGDRRFYQPWWNATSIQEYWRLWNTPVHKWGKRHVYLPLVKQFGFSPGSAAFIVFFISAVLHELLVGVPTHLLTGWAFWGIMGQIPLIYFTAWIESFKPKTQHVELFNTIGNLLFWISFTIVGQPTAIILYYSYWYKNHISP